MEQHFKNKLKNHQIDWDKEGLWEELESQLPTKPSQRRPWLLWLLPLLLLLSIWQIVAHTRTTRMAEHSQDTLIETNHPTASSLIQASELPIVVQPTLPIVKEPAPIVGNANVLATSVPTPSIINTPEYKGVEATPSAAAASSLTEPSAPKTTEFSFTAVEEANDPTTRTTAITAPLTPRSLFVSTSETEDLPPVLRTESMTTRFAPESRFFAATVLSLENTTSTATYLTNNSERIQTARRNQALLTPRQTITRQLEVGYRVADHWAVSVGIGRRTTYERFNFNDIVRVDTVQTVVDKATFFINSSGDTLFFAGNGDQIVQERRIISSVNRLHSTYLPVQVAYMHDFSRWQLNVGAGFTWTTRGAYRGRINEGTLSIVDNPDYRLESRWGYSFGIGTTYQMTTKSSLIARYAYRQSAVWRYQDVQKIYRSNGLQLGIKVRL